MNILCCLLLFYPLADDNQSKAEELAQKLLMIDGHVDLPYRLVEKFEDVSVQTESGDFDFVRAKKGGLDAPFMSIYVPADLEGNGAKAKADELIDLVESICKKHPDKFEIAPTTADVMRIFKQGKIALPLGIENGAPIEGDLKNLKHFFDRGVRYITLTHSKNNHICDSSYDQERKWNGLSPFGKEVVAEMNRLGIMIDVSHISDDTFFQVMALTKVPVIASHSSCRHFTPGFERNMSDEMIKKLAKNGGVIMINYGSFFLKEDYQKVMQDYFMKRGQIQAEKGDEAVEAFDKTYWEKTKRPKRATVHDVADHIEHVIKLVGIDHVGLGSDFDGVGDSLPDGLRDAGEMANLFKVLLDRGYSEADLEKISSGNVLRVWKAVEAFAK